MNLPARANDTPQTPNNGPLCYLHHEDGSWWLVGDDGWPVTPEEFHAEAASAIAAAYFPAIDMDPNPAAQDDDAGRSRRRPGGSLGNDRMISAAPCWCYFVGAVAVRDRF